ncbi:MAG: hypothetical protein KAS62_00360, partial [Candidatus Delongbacteria bacterium]|nr:hypothetical protein [Candidatus Delongbacteria bacterium]
YYKEKWFIMKISKLIRDDYHKLIAMLMAVSYWFFDSSVHYFLYGEFEFEVIPSEFNELWMRLAIFLLIVGYGFFVDRSVRKLKKIQEKLENTLTHLLSGYMPICSICKKVRTSDIDVNDKQYWKEIDSYIAEKTDMQFSHSFCPDCADKMKADINKLKK